jgi:hypothetical protein
VVERDELIRNLCDLAKPVNHLLPDAFQDLLAQAQKRVAHVPSREAREAEPRGDLKHFFEHEAWRVSKGLCIAPKNGYTFEEEWHALDLHAALGDRGIASEVI